MFIFGASGHGKVIYDILQLQEFEVEYFVDDNPKSNTFCDIPLLLTQKTHLTQHEMIIAVGNNLIRKNLAERFSQNTFISSVHPSAVVAREVFLGQGSTVMANAVVNPYSFIGEHCILNTSCSIDHDCVLGDFVHISPHAALAGDVKVGEGTHIGIGACVIQGIKIGKFATIGAGAVIINDVPDGATVVGNPGKTIKLKQL